MFGLGQEVCRPSTQELIRDRHICKGNVLSRRKSFKQLAKEEQGRLVLPDIHNSRSNDTIPTKYEKETKAKGHIRKGYTFEPSKLKTDQANSVPLDDDDIEQLLSSKLLDSQHTKDEEREGSFYTEKYWNRRTSSDKSEHRNRRGDSRGNDSGFSESSTNGMENNVNEYSYHVDPPRRSQRFDAKKIKCSLEEVRGLTGERQSSFSNVPCGVELPSRLIVRKTERVDAGAITCTQSLNSLCTDLAMFKDAFSRGLVRENRPVEGATTLHWPLNIVNEKTESWAMSREKELEKLSRNSSVESKPRSSPTRSESVTSSIPFSTDKTFAVFKKNRKNLMSRQLKSRESKCSREGNSPLFGSDTEAGKNSCDLPGLSGLSAASEGKTNGTYACRKKSVVSETTDGCCTCFVPPRVEFSLRDDVKTEQKSTRSKKREVKLPTNYYECYTAVPSKAVHFTSEKGRDLLNQPVPFKVDSKVSTMQRALAEFKARRPKTHLLKKDQSVLSDSPVSPIKKTLVKSTSKDWPPEMKLSDDEEEEADERSSLSGNDETFSDVNSKCNEWLSRWIQGNQGVDDAHKFQEQILISN